MVEIGGLSFKEGLKIYTSVYVVRNSKYDYLTRHLLFLQVIIVLRWKSFLSDLDHRYIFKKILYFKHDIGYKFCYKVFYMTYRSSIDLEIQILSTV